MKLIKSFSHAFRGLMLAVREQRNIKIHLAAACIVLAAGFYLNFSYVDWGLSCLAIGLVLGFEIMNTAIEELVNFVSPEKRREAKRIKDFAAAAVLVASITALIIGLLILISKIL